jgi:hypothetical protein
LLNYKPPRVAAGIALADKLHSIRSNHADSMDRPSFNPEALSNIEANRLGARGASEHFWPLIAPYLDYLGVTDRKIGVRNHEFRMPERADLVCHLVWLLDSQQRSPGIEVLAVAVPSDSWDGLGFILKIRLRPWSKGLLFDDDDKPDFHQLMLCPELLTPALVKWDDEFSESMRSAMHAAAKSVLAEIDSNLKQAGSSHKERLFPRLMPTERRLPHIAWSVSGISLIQSVSGKIQPLPNPDDGGSPLRGCILDPKIQKAITAQALRNGDCRIELRGRSASAALYWGFVDVFRGATAAAAPLLGQVSTGNDLQAAPRFEPVAEISKKLQMLNLAHKEFIPDLDQVFVVDLEGSGIAPEALQSLKFGVSNWP